MPETHSSETAARENWKPVAGFNGSYEVSDQGRVRSWRKRGGGRLAAPRLLRPGRCKSGHMTVMLGRGNTRYVHHLVLEAFVGPRPEGLDGLHGPGGPGDNSLANLCWGTPEKNLGEDRVRDGTDNRGEKHPLHKLT